MLWLTFFPGSKFFKPVYLFQCHCLIPKLCGCAVDRNSAITSQVCSVLCVVSCLSFRCFRSHSCMVPKRNPFLRSFQHQAGGDLNARDFIIGHSTYNLSNRKRMVSTLCCGFKKLLGSSHSFNLDEGYPRREEYAISSKFEFMWITIEYILRIWVGG